MFIALSSCFTSAPSGAACKHIALRWSAQALKCKAINIVLLRSTARETFGPNRFAQAALDRGSTTSWTLYLGIAIIAL